MKKLITIVKIKLKANLKVSKKLSLKEIMLGVSRKRKKKNRKKKRVILGTEKI